MIRIDGALLSSGLKAATITLRSLSNRATPDSIRDEINRRAVQFLQSLVGLNLNSLPAVAAYKALYAHWGIPRSVLRPSIERMTAMLMRGRALPSINLLVDMYNLRSVETQMCMGAHDLDKLRLPIKLQPVEGREIFTPIGGAPEAVRKGEYAYFDAGGSIICRVNAVQGDVSKVTENTRDVLLIVESTAIRSDDELLSAARDTAALITEHLGGEASEPEIASPFFKP